MKLNPSMQQQTFKHPWYTYLDLKAILQLKKLFKKHSSSTKPTPGKPSEIYRDPLAYTHISVLDYDEGLSDFDKWYEAVINEPYDPMNGSKY